jgi:DNA-binding HxlR family transcriptional regulator
MAEAPKDEVTVSKAALKEIMSHLEKIERILRKEDPNAPERVSHE